MDFAEGIAHVKVLACVCRLQTVSRNWYNINPNRMILTILTFQLLAIGLDDLRTSVP